jgi:hypothetical protein
LCSSFSIPEFSRALISTWVIVGQRRAFNHADIHAAAFDPGFPPSIPSALVVISVTSGPDGCSDKTESTRRSAQ